jgi:hypothetical protein
MKRNKRSKGIVMDLSSLKGKLVIVKVGNEDRPACPDDIKNMLKQIKSALAGTKCRLLVTHHAVEIEVI